MSPRLKMISAGAILIATLSCLIGGCGHYPEVSATTYEHAKALYAVCNRRDAARLDVCEEMIDDAVAENQVSSSEAGYLREIVATARNAKWAEAQAMARQLMADQVNR